MPPAIQRVARTGPEELEDRRQVAVVGEDLLEDRRQPQRRADGQRHDDARPETPAAARSPRPPGDQRGDEAGTEHERGVPDVGLDDEGPDADEPRQHDDVTIGQRPRQQQVREEGHHGNPRIPRIDEQVRVVGQGQDEQHHRHEGSQGHSAASPGDDQGADDRRGVEQGDADEDAGRAEHPVERSEQPEQQRPGVVPPVAGMGARQGRVAPPDVVDLEEFDCKIRGRMPMPSEQRQRCRDRRSQGGDDEYDEHGVRSSR